MTIENIEQSHGAMAGQKQNYMTFLPALEAVRNLAAENRPLIIAIDGRCGSGKSTLSALLAKEFDCNVFHMDDFFLPFDMRTKERLAEPGGNVHYERFDAEVLKPLQNRQAVTYMPFNCANGALDGPIYVEYKNLTIIEGSYSMHPTLQQAIDCSIFITLSPQVQRERIRSRGGDRMLENFINKWIPLEEHYFSALKIQERCDLVIDTSDHCISSKI